MLFHILRYKFLSYIKTTFDLRLISMVRGLMSLLVFGGFAYGAYLFALHTTRFLIEYTHTGLYLYHTFVSMILFVFFIAVNFGNVIVSYSTLYRSTEVGFLFTKPVSYTSIFVLKFLDNFFYSSTTLFLGAFMLLLGYGTYFAQPWYFFIGVMIFVLVPYMFLSACLAVLILMGVMKLAARVGFRKVMAGLFAFYFFLSVLFFQYSNPITMVESISRYFPNVDTYLEHSIPKFLQYLPNQWVANFLYYSARQEMVQALPYAFLLLLVTAAMFGLSLLVANRFYYRSWLVSLQVRSTERTSHKSRREHFLDFQSRSIFSSQTEVVLKKELWTFFRDASQWMHLLVMLILTSLFTVSVSHLNLRLQVLDIQLMTYLVLFAFSGFMVSSLALRFVFPLIGLEGQAFWVLRSSPIKGSKIFIVKFFLGFILVLILAEYIAISSNMPFLRKTEARPLLMWFGIFAAFWISFATVSMNLGFGGAFANYAERNPIRAASTQGATLTFLLTLIYLLVVASLIFTPISAYFTMLFQYKIFPMNMIVLPGTLFAVLSYLLFALGWVIGLRSIQKDF